MVVLQLPHSLRGNAPPAQSRSRWRERKVSDEDADLTALAIDAIRRLPRAEYAIVNSFELELGDGSFWRPRQGSCHANVATIVKRFKGLRHVFGYLVLSPESTGKPHWIVAAHSLVEYPNGHLFEVTLEADDAYGVPFIRHRGDDDQHRRFREAVKIFISPQQLADSS